MTLGSSQTWTRGVAQGGSEGSSVQGEECMQRHGGGIGSGSQGLECQGKGLDCILREQGRGMEGAPWGPAREDDGRCPRLRWGVWGWAEGGTSNGRLPSTPGGASTSHLDLQC